ncbi:MAG: DUF3592 domain-containing protein [Paracoccaceae bacterium]
MPRPDQFRPPLPPPALGWLASREALAGLAALALSVLLFVLAWQDLRDGFRLLRHGVMTEARVTRLDYSCLDRWSPRCGRWIQNVTVEFTTLDGKVHSHTERAGLAGGSDEGFRFAVFTAADLPVPYEVGQTVRLIYLPSDPAIVDIGWIRMQDRGFMLGVGGVLALFSGAGLIVLSYLGLARGMI